MPRVKTILRSILNSILNSILHSLRRPMAGALATALSLAACGTDAPPPPPAAPATPLAFTDAAPLVVAEVEELHEDAQGRVWLALYQRPGLVRATFGETTSADTLGALGSEPGQFRMPFWVMDAPSAGIFALDGVARRLVGFAADGSADSVLAVPSSLDQFLVRRDTLGAWVSALSDLTREDSVPIVRLADGVVDTIARLHVPKATVSIPLGERTYVGPPEYAARDIWGVLANGTVWIARGGTHQVDYRLPGGAWTIGGPSPFQPVRSGEADRGLMRGLPAAAGIPVAAVQYAPIKGPFIEARGAPDGEVWTWRTQAAPKSEERYTVFRPGEAETHDVVLPLYHRVVGLGRQSVYVAERLEDGHWRVTRHPRPTF
jgi:hypothetical protein